jgi:hypothetical protein
MDASVRCDKVCCGGVEWGAVHSCDSAARFLDDQCAGGDIQGLRLCSQNPSKRPAAT